MSEKITRFSVDGPAQLLDFLLARLQGRGRNSVKALLARRSVSVDGRVVTRFDHQLAAGQSVELIRAGRPEAGLSGLRLIYEDESLLVVDKPAGLLSVADDSRQEDNAFALLRRRAERTGGRVYSVHRLDRETSGLLLFAKSRQVQQTLQKNWQEAVVDRRYAAVVEGRPAEAEGTLVSWLKENKNLVMYSSGKPGDGEKAVTRYRVLSGNAAYTLVEARLETGKKNQIRVQLRELGHSVVGDAKYGAGSNPLRRLALHAQVLAFRHPASGRIMRFESPVPEEFLKLVGK